MAENIDRLAEKLGATRKGQVPEYGAGAIGAAKLAEHLRARLELSSGSAIETTPSRDRPLLRGNNG